MIYVKSWIIDSVCYSVLYSIVLDDQYIFSVKYNLLRSNKKKTL